MRKTVNGVSSREYRVEIQTPPTYAAHCVALESSRGEKISKEKAANKNEGITAIAYIA